MFTPPNMSLVMCHMSRVMCHVSCVMCHVSRVTCHMSKKKLYFNFLIFFLLLFLKKLDKVVELVGGGSVINGAYPVQFMTESTIINHLMVLIGPNGPNRTWQRRKNILTIGLLNESVNEGQRCLQSSPWLCPGLVIIYIFDKLPYLSKYNKKYI